MNRLRFEVGFFWVKKYFNSFSTNFNFSIFFVPNLFRSPEGWERACIEAAARGQHWVWNPKQGSRKAMRRFRGFNFGFWAVPHGLAYWRGPWIFVRNLVVFMNSNLASINGAMMWVVFMCGVQRKAKVSVWVPTCGDELLGECDVEVVVEVCGMSETRRLEKVIFFILFLEVAPPLPPRLLTHEHAQTTMLKRWRSWLPVWYIVYI